MKANIALDCGGVLLYVNGAEEISYIETSPEFEMEALKVCEILARRNGFELMGEDEGGVEEFEDGRVRHWLAQTAFVQMSTEIDNEKKGVAFAS
jgi:hypothetical protein